MAMGNFGYFSAAEGNLDRKAFTTQTRDRAATNQQEIFKYDHLASVRYRNYT